MTDHEVVEAELRAVVDEAIGALRLISEAPGMLRRSRVSKMLAEAKRALEAADLLARRLP